MQPAPLVLIVDDDRDSREMYGEFLRLVGVDVEQAGNADDAWTRLRARRPHVIVLDLALPGLDGAALSRQIRSDPDIGRIPLVILTGYTHGDVWVRAQDAGADAILIKPCPPERLMATLRDMLARSGVDPASRS
jgi:CheY-like chemotaxis protein